MKLKKIIAAALSVAMIASLSLAAFADTTYTSDSDLLNEENSSYTEWSDSNTSSSSVTGTYSESAADADTVYYVTVSWGNINAVYSGEGAYVWDATTMQYEDASTYSGTDASFEVTVSNQSNAAVTAAISYSESISSSVEWSAVDGNNDTIELNDDATTLSTADSGLVTENSDGTYTYDTTSTGTAQSATFSGTVTVTDVTALGTTDTTIGTATVTITAADDTEE